MPTGFTQVRDEGRRGAYCFVDFGSPLAARAVMDAFAGYGLERKGPALGYASVKQSTQERIYLYGPRADWNPDGAC